MVYFDQILHSVHVNILPLACVKAFFDGQSKGLLSSISAGCGQLVNI